jgi:hypothetical protein
MKMESAITVQRLSEMIIAEWLDAQSDNGAIWQKSWHALQLAKQDAGEEKIMAAYKLAYSRMDAMRRDHAGA